jgi:hypothetical protein
MFRKNYWLLRMMLTLIILSPLYESKIILSLKLGFISLTNFFQHEYMNLSSGCLQEDKIGDVNTCPEVRSTKYMLV